MRIVRVGTKEITRGEGNGLRQEISAPSDSRSGYPHARQLDRPIVPPKLNLLPVQRADGADQNMSQSSCGRVS